MSSFCNIFLLRLIVHFQTVCFQKLKIMSWIYRSIRIHRFNKIINRYLLFVIPDEINFIIHILTISH